MADLARAALQKPLANIEGAESPVSSREIYEREYADNREREYLPGSLGRFAQEALKAGATLEQAVDSSHRSRDILDAEYADYSDRRIRR